MVTALVAVTDITNSTHAPLVMRCPALADRLSAFNPKLVLAIQHAILILVIPAPLAATSPDALYIPALAPDLVLCLPARKTVIAPQTAKANIVSILAKLDTLFPEILASKTVFLTIVQIFRSQLLRPMPNMKPVRSDAAALSQDIVSNHAKSDISKIINPAQNVPNLIHHALLTKRSSILAQTHQETPLATV